MGYVSVAKQKISVAVWLPCSACSPRLNRLRFGSAGEIVASARITATDAAPHTTAMALQGGHRRVNHD